MEMSSWYCFFFSLYVCVERFYMCLLSSIFLLKSDKENGVRKNMRRLLLGLVRWRRGQ